MWSQVDVENLIVGTLEGLQFFLSDQLFNIEKHLTVPCVSLPTFLVVMKNDLF